MESTQPREPYRILFFISSFRGVNSGFGGHYRSLRAIAEHLSKCWPQVTSKIVVLGDIPTSAFDGATVEVVQVSTTGKSFVGFAREVLNVARAFAPTHIHSISINAHALGRWAARVTGAKRYMTHPGGPNPARYVPYSPDIVCFSEENRSFFAGLSKLRSSRVHLIPQRVSQGAIDRVRMADLRARVGHDRIIILRIARVGLLHESSIMQTLNLAAQLRGNGLDASAVVVGSKEDVDVARRVSAAAGPADLITHDRYFTDNAAELIPIAHGVVGTGRGIVEAALHGKTLFCPLQDAELPVLVTRENYPGLLATNFSARSVIADRSAPSLDKVLAAINLDENVAARLIARELNLDEAVGDYAALYDAPQPRRERLLDLIVHTAWIHLYRLPKNARRSAA